MDILVLQPTALVDSGNLFYWKWGSFQISVDSFRESPGSGRMAIILLNRHDSSPSTTHQRLHDEVYQTPRFRSAHPYRNCETRLDPSRYLRPDDPDCSRLSHLQNLPLSA